MRVQNKEWPTRAQDRSWYGATRFTREKLSTGVEDTNKKGLRRPIGLQATQTSPPRRQSSPCIASRDIEGTHALSVSDVLDFTLRISGHFLVEEEGHHASVSLAIDARHVRLSAALRAREGSRAHLPCRPDRILHRHAAHAETGGAGDVPGGLAVRAARELPHLVDFDLSCERMRADQGKRGQFRVLLRQ